MLRTSRALAAIVLTAATGAGQMSVGQDASGGAAAGAQNAPATQLPPQVAPPSGQLSTSGVNPPQTAGGNNGPGAATGNFVPGIDVPTVPGAPGTPVMDPTGGLGLPPSDQFLPNNESPTSNPMSAVGNAIHPPSIRAAQQRAAQSTGQESGSGSTGTGSDLGSLGSGLISGGGGGGWGASIPPYAAYGHGLADMIRSSGYASMMGSEAVKNLTEAQAQDLRNREEWARAFMQARMMNNQYRAALEGPRPTEEDLIRYAQAGRPERLSPSELDTVSGRINWPVLLEDEKFLPQRQELERLFAYRANVGGLDRDAYLAIDRLTDVMVQLLMTDIDDVPPQDYVKSKRFLESLAYEAQLPSI